MRLKDGTHVRFVQRAARRVVRRAQDKKRLRLADNGVANALDVKRHIVIELDDRFGPSHAVYQQPVYGKRGLANDNLRMRVHEGKQKDHEHFIGPVAHDDPRRRHSRIPRKLFFQPVGHKIRIQVPWPVPAKLRDFLFYRGRPVAGVFVLVELDTGLAGF